MIAIVDYGMGNLRSVQKAFEFLGMDAQLTNDTKVLDNATHVVLPGVGAVADALNHLKEKSLDVEMKRQVDKGKPFLGICLGMQLLLDKSYENGEYNCLGLIPGNVIPFQLEEYRLRVPHMGWNSIRISDSPIFDAGSEPYVYFVHSYHAADVPKEYVIASCNYGYDFVCGVQKENVFGLQFHPEKSGEDGLEILKQFGGMA